MDNAGALPTTPQAPQPPQKRSIDVLPKPDNLTCYLHGSRPPAARDEGGRKTRQVRAMCTVVLLRRPGHAWPLLLAANRDEMADRPWRAPARHWPDRSAVTAGLDLLGGGTWLGVNDNGVAAAVLNRINTLGPAPGRRSRGELPLIALDHPTAGRAAGALARIDPGAYRPFNMVVADAEAAYCVRCTEAVERGAAEATVGVEAVPDGLSMITAYDRNDRRSPRIR